MHLRTRITQAAHERGWKAVQVARHLGWHRSNLSAADHGKRPISLRALAKAAEFLGCDPSDLIEIVASSEKRLFSNRCADDLLQERDREICDGAERAWVHTFLLAWQRHYQKR